MIRVLPIITLVLLLTLLACGGGAGATPTGLPPTKEATPAAAKGTTAPAATPAGTAGAYPPIGASGASGAIIAPQYVTVTVTQTASLGKYLVDQDGRTLYLFLNDTGTTSTCYDNCAKAWPPLVFTKQAMAGMNVDEKLIGTTKRTDGTTQVTYNGHPLYYFAKDTKPGDTKGQGVNGAGNYWYVVSPTGDAVK